MENIADLKPYLNLREGEEILFINRYEKEYHLPIKDLLKFHEPEKFPKHLIIKKKKDYVYTPIDIITNFRIILFGINFQYVKDDQVTPISEVLHIENFIFWINNEDISDFEIKFGDNLEKEIHFIFYHKGFRNRKSPIYIDLFNSKDYFRMKELIINLFKFEEEEINQIEQKNIDLIITNNKKVFYVGLILLVILSSLFLYIAFDSTLDKIEKIRVYFFVILHVLFLPFFIIYNLININNLQKTCKSENFLKLIDIDLSGSTVPAWYKVTFINFIVLLIVILIQTFNVTLSH